MSKTPRIVAGIGLLLLMSAVVLFLALPEPTAGDPGSVEEALGGGVSPSTSTTVAQPILSTVNDSEASLVIAPNEASKLEDVAAVGGLIPTRLRIGAISVDAPVTRAGVDTRTGQMEVPRNVTDVAWYEYGPAPGETGSAVLAAHVDLASEGPGVFFDLRELQPGDRIEVVFDDGSVSVFSVLARTVYEKEELPVDVIFSREGQPVLTLVTCGGGFNATAQSYDSNVVVYAAPEAVPSDGPASTE